MTINQLTPGAVVSCTCEGSKITLGDSLIIDTTLIQTDSPREISICADAEGGLHIGPSVRYVAQIRIPAREYEPPAEDGGGLTPLPLDVEQVTVSLWGDEICQ